MKTMHELWTAETSDGSFVAGITINGQDHTSPPFATEAEADAEMRRLIAEIEKIAAHCGVTLERTDLEPEAAL